MGKGMCGEFGQPSGGDSYINPRPCMPSVVETGNPWKMMPDIYLSPKRNRTFELGDTAETTRCRLSPARTINGCSHTGPAASDRIEEVYLGLSWSSTEGPR
jgi:hypothetical protein